MKFFDRVSEDAQKVLQQVEGIAPSGFNWDRMYSKSLEAFFIKGQPLPKIYDDLLIVGLSFTRNVSEGALKTNISTTGGEYFQGVYLDIYLDRGGNNSVTITKIGFRTNRIGDDNESPATVRHVQKWIRDRVLPYFMKEKEDREAEEREREQLRNKYKP